MMIAVDVKEFRGDRKLLAKLLQEKLKVQAKLERNVIRVGSGDRPETQPNIHEVKDVVKRTLHRMGMDAYHVVAQTGVVSVRERKAREHYARRKGSAPSVQQTVPYFFPG